MDIYYPKHNMCHQKDIGGVNSAVVAINETTKIGYSRKAMSTRERELDRAIASIASIGTEGMWTRNCAKCKAPLSKSNPPDYDLTCGCGWLWSGK